MYNISKQWQELKDKMDNLAAIEAKIIITIVMRNSIVKNMQVKNKGEKNN